MDLVDRYVNAVRQFLPKAQQDDIAQELAANLRAELDDHAEALGRPLSEDEQERIVQAHGHPLLAAGRYHAGQGGLVFGRQLISPALFPFYLRAMGILLAIAVVIHTVVIIAIAQVSEEPFKFSDILSALVPQALWIFSTMTVLFAAADAVLPTLQWTVRGLPAASEAQRPGTYVSRIESLVEIVVLVGVGVLLVLAIARPTSLLAMAAGPYRLGPIWAQVIVPIVLIFAVNIVRAVINLARPRWVGLRAVVRVLTDLAVIGIALSLALGSGWVVLGTPSGETAALGSLNRWLGYGLWIMVGLCVLVALANAWKLLRPTRARV